MKKWPIVLFTVIAVLLAVLCTGCSNKEGLRESEKTGSIQEAPNTGVAQETETTAAVNEVTINPEVIQSAIDSVTMEEVTLDTYRTTVSFTYDQFDFYSTSGSNEKITIKMTGEVKAVIDFRRITFEVDDQNKTILFNMPEVNVLNTELDETKTQISSSTGNTNPRVDSGMLNNLRSKARSGIMERANSQGIHSKATANAEARIRSLLAGCDLGNYSVAFQWP